MFESDMIKSKIQALVNEYTEDNSISNSIDHILKKINDVIYDVCEKSLKKKMQGKSTKKNITKKKWFDSDLYAMRKVLLQKSLAYSKNPTDPTIRGSFYKTRKIHRKCCKRKKHQLKQHIIQRLDSLYENNPNEYWT